jgi:hypothetical protein
MPAATSSSDGYLSSADWTAFNTKQPTVSITVGPSGTGARYVCDGTADQVEIQAAIDYVDALGGGVVELLAGTSNLSCVGYQPHPQRDQQGLRAIPAAITATRPRRTAPTSKLAATR